MSEQLRALIALRLALLKNTFSPHKKASMVISILGVMLALLVAWAAAIGLFFFAMQFGSEDVPYLVFAVDGMVVFFLFFWCFGLLMELQRSEVIDFRKMLFLPVSLPMVFVLNFLASLFSLSAILFLFPMLGFVIGLAVALGPRMLLAIPLALVFFLMVSSWSYYVQGILSALLENKRRRRIVLTVIPMAFVILGQLPNLITHTFIRRPQQNQVGAHDPEAYEAAQQEFRRVQRERAQVAMQWVKVANIVVPIGWLPYAVSALADHRPLGVMGGLTGMAALTALGLAVGYRATRRYYLGVESSRRRTPPSPEAVQKARSAATKPDTRSLVGRSLPFVEDDTAAMAWASFVTYLRQPNIYMMALGPLVLGVLFLIIYAPNAARQPSEAQRMLIPLLATIWPMFNFGMLLFNAFGVDKDGFRAMVLLPTARRKYLLGKNLSLAPIVIGSGVFFVTLSSILVRPHPFVIMACYLQTLQLYTSFCAVGNLTSVYFPYRMAWEGLRTRTSQSVNFLVGLVTLFLATGILLPTAACLALDLLLAHLWDYQGPPVAGLAGSALMLALSLALYVIALKWGGTLLQRRELIVLDRLVRDTE